MQIEISKSDNQLRLVDNSRVVFEFKCWIGKNPGRKLKKGDQKTPQGEYVIVVKNPKSKYYLSLGLNYPNSQDAYDAFEQKIINKKTRDRIVLAQEKYKLNPQTIIPWNTAMEGKIYIHGEANNNKKYTKGCIKLKNSDIERLYKMTKVGMKVVIRA